MLIGIAGTLGAGKGTVVEYLLKLGFKHYSGSGKLREILESRNIEPNRDEYSKLADEIRGEDPRGLTKLLWSDYENDAPEKAIIEALHDVEEAKFIKEQGGIVIGVDADMEVRYSRIHTRGSEKDNVSFEEFKRLARHEEEGGGTHNIRAVLELADYTIENNGTLEELHAQVDAILKKISDTN